MFPPPPARSQYSVLISVQPTRRGEGEIGWVFWKFWVGGWVSNPPPSCGAGTFFGVWVLMGSWQGCIRVGGWVGGCVPARVPCLVVHISYPTLHHASFTENDACMVMWIWCKYKSELNTGSVFLGIDGHAGQLHDAVRGHWWTWMAARWPARTRWRLGPCEARRGS